MKHRLKHILKLAACVALLIAAAPLMAADQYGLTQTNMTLAITNISASSTSNILTGVVNTRMHQEVGVSFGVFLANTNAAGGSTSITLNFGTSVTNTSKFNNNTNSFIPVVATAQGTTVVWVSTNIYVGSMPYLGIVQEVNGNTNATASITNFQYVFKDARNGKRP